MGKTIKAKRNPMGSTQRKGPFAGGSGHSRQFAVPMVVATAPLNAVNTVTPQHPIYPQKARLYQNGSRNPYARNQKPSKVTHTGKQHVW